MRKYDHSKIERKWQKYWQIKKIYKTQDKARGKKNKMLLVEFPYPSGNLHIGHWFAFAVPDILARYKKMIGENVMYPIGFDAFGLPAENAAIKRKINPRDWTEKNIKFMTKQLESMGASFDWSRKVSTIDPEYYKWTQWLFLQMYKNKLAYRAKTAANWCPSCKTVLANEQVVDGKCERCGSDIIQKYLEQWMLKITDYADRLIDDIEGLDWPEATKLAQKNWIGRSEGAIIKFNIKNNISKTTDETFKFRPYLIEPILSGQKYSTYRLEPKNVNEGDILELLNWETKEKFALAKIAKIEKKKIGEISEKDQGHEKYKNRKEMYRAYEKYYKTQVDDDTDVWIYRFEIVPEHIEVFTTRPDTIFGATYVVLAPEHKIVASLLTNYKLQITNYEEVQKYIKETQRKTDLERQENKEKTGVELKGIKAINPANGKEIPVWISDYVLAGYGTGAVMAVPAHDERDFEFARKFNLPIHYVIELSLPAVEKGELIITNRAYEGGGVMINSGQFTGIESENARREIVDWLEKQGKAKKQKNYRLRDWLISRQRYWGVPIPIVKCEKCGYVPVPEKDLPVKLPPLKDFLPADDGRSPLAKAKKWASVKCLKCKGKAERETDTMDTFVDSSWYFIRYADPKNKKKFADAQKMKNWLPVSMYIGGAEHNTMHLLYSRFFTKVLYDLKLINFKEPFVGRRNHGVILGPDGQKMSKSKGNVIDPDEEVKKYGADCVRMYLAFMGPYEQGGPWNPTGILGIKRFLDRVWSLEFKVQSSKLKAQVKNQDLEKLLHKTIKKVTEDIESFRFNTAISSMMILLNTLEKEQRVSLIQYSKFLIILSPFAPYVTEEIWQSILGHKKSIHLEKWPKYDQKLIKEDSYKLIVQVNGKMREVIDMAIGSSEGDAKKTALSADNVKKWTEGKEIKKIIFVKDRLINFIV